METKVLEFKWTVSRGRDTYGYNICSLWVDGVKVSSCNGGGYDMQGTAFAEWIENYQQRLLGIARKAGSLVRTDIKGKAFLDLRPKPQGELRCKVDNLYGMRSYYYCNNVDDFDNSKNYVPKRVSLDGACGFSCIEKIAKEIGIILKFNHRKGDNVTYQAEITQA